MLIVGLCGATCSGKTSLALEIKTLLPNIHIISQDDYFREVDDPKHIWIPELNHINFDIISSLNMEQMHLDIQKYISNHTSYKCWTNRSEIPNSSLEPLDYLQKKACEKIENLKMSVLIIEGFCIYNYKPVSDLCNLKYFLTVSKTECYNRRSRRVYEPPDCPGYFEICAWPEYQKLLDQLRNSIKDVQYMENEGEENSKAILRKFLLDIINY